MAKWISVGLAVFVLVCTGIFFVAIVQAKTDENCKRIQKIETQHEELREVIHRMDKRQVIIMHKLGAEDKRVEPE